MPIKQKMVMDFGRPFVLRDPMESDTENNIRQICTEIGAIMEDASVVALIWKKDGDVSIPERLQLLRDAHLQIGMLLKQAADSRIKHCCVGRSLLSSFRARARPADFRSDGLKCLRPYIKCNVGKATAVVFQPALRLVFLRLSQQNVRLPASHLRRYKR